MKLSPLKLTVIFIAVLAIFFAVTFSNNWGNVTAEKKVEDLAPLIKALKNDMKAAKKKCPTFIKKLRESAQNLEGKDVKINRFNATKLISDCEVASGDYVGAAKSFQTLIEMEPQRARWHGDLADSLLKTGKVDQAARSVRLAVQLDPNEYKWRILEARVLAKTPMVYRAKEAYEAALKVAPYEKVPEVQAELSKLR